MARIKDFHDVSKLNLKSESDRIRIFFISRVLSFKRVAVVHLKSCIMIVFISVPIFFLLELLY